MQIDSLKQSTLLDKKATINIGNDLRKGNTYKHLYTGCSKLLDSLIKESKLHEQQVRFLKDSIIQPLKILSVEKQAEAKFNKEKYVSQNKYYQSEIKKQKSKKWTWLGVGVGIGVIFALLIGN